MNIVKPITPQIPDRVTKTLRLLITCRQGEDSTL